MVEAVWTARASMGLQEVYEWLEDRREGSGDRLLEEVDEAIGLLRSFPEMGSIFEYPVRRWMVSKNHAVIYAHEPRGLVLLYFVDLRRDMMPVREEIRRWYERIRDASDDDSA